LYVSISLGDSSEVRHTPLALRSDVLVQVERDLVLLKLELKLSEVGGDDESTGFSAELADLGLCDVLSGKASGCTIVRLKLHSEECRGYVPAASKM
jgi:hypothetical protein